MLVYSNTLVEFLRDVADNVIDTKVRDAVQQYLRIRVGASEFQSWSNSLTRVGTSLMHSDLPEDAGISIEFQLPTTAKRIDFIVSGFDTNQKPQVVILELKQWTEASLSERDGLVKTWLGRGLHQTAHPSYQAWSYATFLENFNEAVSNNEINLNPCAYLHNCTDTTVLLDSRYESYLKKAPLFFKEDSASLRDHLCSLIASGDNASIMRDIDNGRIRPSRSLADSLADLLSKRQEFVLLDEQKVVFESSMSAMIQTKTNPREKKQVLIVRGGPGTGKSVVAINLLVRAISESINARYVTKNAAPRDVYAAKLTGTMTKSRFSLLFTGSGGFTDSNKDEYDALIVDEAHRLNEKSGLFSNLGFNQISEIIKAARTSIFFIDEAQRIHIKDIGSEEEIRVHAVAQGADITTLDLPSQFRCNGSDGYIAFVDNFLGIRETAHPDLGDLDYEFHVADSPNELDGWVRQRNDGENKARMVAGYCWDWNSKNDKNAKDITFPEYGFERQWNLSTDAGLWILQPHSIDQVGCIHTCQGLECEYVGVIIGPDLRRCLTTGELETFPENRSKNDRSIFGWKKAMKEHPEVTKRQLDSIIRNTYRCLMTRGMKGCAIWFADEN
ncbi:MAG: DNA/RNA helicase domain-containing protein [Pirellulales bacterium]